MFNCKKCNCTMAERNIGYKNQCHTCWSKLVWWQQ